MLFFGLKNYNNGISNRQVIKESKSVSDFKLKEPFIQPRYHNSWKLTISFD